MGKIALITGITGQDGSYLAEFLLKKGYSVHGLFRKDAPKNYCGKIPEEIIPRINRVDGDVADFESIKKLLGSLQPDEVYNLAGISHVGKSFTIPMETFQVNSVGVLNILESARICCPHTRIYQASTSEIFGKSQDTLLTEESHMLPVSPYAISKLAAHHLCRAYRTGYNMFVSCGILFNHESPRRDEIYVTRKITAAVARILHKQQGYLELGHLQSYRDWGWAPEYVEGMWRILNHAQPDDFIIATGETHSLEEFVERAFSRAGLDYKDYLRLNQHLARPVDVIKLAGSTEKIEKFLHWKPKIAFADVVDRMVDADLEHFGRL